MSDDRDTLARVISDSFSASFQPTGTTLRRTADRILASDWLAAHDRAVAQRALRDAAAEYPKPPGPYRAAPTGWTDPVPWLRDRAAALGEQL